MIRASLAWLLLALAFSLPAAQAQEAQAAQGGQKPKGLTFATDPTAPVDIAAGRVDWHADDGRAAFTQGASFQQGPMKMTAARMNLQMTADGTPETLTAIGDVVLISFAADGREMRRATAAKAVYRPQDESLAMNGQVTLDEKGERPGLLRGENLTIDMRSGRAELTGGKKSRARIELR